MLVRSFSLNGPGPVQQRRVTKSRFVIAHRGLTSQTAAFPHFLRDINSYAYCFESPAVPLVHVMMGVEMMLEGDVAPDQVYQIRLFIRD